MKKGIVLMMTLGFIAVITALILWSLTITKDRFDKVSQINMQNQFNIVFQDFSKLVKSIDLRNRDKLNAFLSISFPSLPRPKTGLGLGFSSNSQMSKLNINYMLKTMVDSEKNSTLAPKAAYYKRAIEKYLAKFDLSNPYEFENILLDCIDLDDIERGVDSEIVIDDFDFKQGKIVNFKQIQKIKDAYYKSSRDLNIYKINRDDFERYFYYGDTKKYGVLDCEADGIEDTIALIVEDEMSITDDSDICQEANSTSMQILKKLYNISSDLNKSKYLVKCRVNLDNDDFHQVISFDFEINSKRISNIDKTFN